MVAHAEQGGSDRMMTMNLALVFVIAALLAPVIVWVLAELSPSTFRRAVRWLRMGLHL